MLVGRWRRMKKLILITSLFNTNGKRTNSAAFRTTTKPYKTFYNTRQTKFKVFLA